ncbi:response regulator [Ideonella sp.]|uniref:response regulator n=1 Tax=Ideonella sp. TaxID=1929293 RepID=UPI002B45B1B7|nr:response regulator [Ideonella sp.]HJV70781.1 response regulator [Ideonella sp.]
MPNDPGSAPILRVLYIEDNPVNEMLVREMLGLRPGIALDSAPDGGSGIACALAQRPDLILLDLQLPDMSGVDVLRALRPEPSLAQCRFIALSANAMPDDVSQALSAGFNEYWTKPLNLQRFLADMDALARRLGRA